MGFGAWGFGFGGFESLLGGFGMQDMESLSCGCKGLGWFSVDLGFDDVGHKNKTNRVWSLGFIRVRAVG